MELILRVAANEIKEVKSSSYYNHIMWEFKNVNKLGITHFVEVYDDVSDWPDYKLGYMSDDKFVFKASGFGDEVPVAKIGTGGVFFDIHVHYPVSLLITTKEK